MKVPDVFHFFNADLEQLCNQNTGIISRLPQPHLGAFRHQAHLLAHALEFYARALLGLLPCLKQAFGGPQPCAGIGDAVAQGGNTFPL